MEPMSQQRLRIRCCSAQECLSEKYGFEPVQWKQEPARPASESESANEMGPN